MRELKFRVWHKPSKRMVGWNILKKALFYNYKYVSLPVDFGGAPIPNNAPLVEHRISTPWNFFGDDDCEVMQYIGLQDKNGKEIYEGDVVTASDVAVDYGTCIVKWFCGGFCLMKRLDDNLDGFEGRFDTPDFECEIIGNKYENPRVTLD